MKQWKPWEELTIQDNFMFQKVMRNEQLCRIFLERVLGISIRVLEYPQTEKNIDTDYKSRSVRLDVYAEERDGRVFDIEMQAVDMQEKMLPLRLRYYQAMIDQSLLEKGFPYSKLRETHIIFICPFDPFMLGLRRYTFRNRCDQRQDLVLADRTTKTFLNTRGTLGSESADVQAFMEYVNTNVARDGFAAAIAAEVAKVKANHEHRRLYMTLAMDMLEYVEENKDVWFAEGRAEGRAEGEAKGRAEGKAERTREVAQNLLHLGVPVAQIAAATGFSPAEIEALRKVQ